MGFLKKLKFWKKRSNTLTKVDACVSPEDPRTTDSATVTMDPTVMCAAYTQTESRMDSGGDAAAAKGEYEHGLDVKNQNIQELEEELAVSKRLTSDVMLNVNSVEQQVRKYAEEPAILWSDDCECKQQVSAVADLLKKIIITGRDAKKSKPEATSGRNTKVDYETQTESNSRQRDCARADEKKTVRRLEEKNRKLSILVEEYERKIAQLNEEIEHIVRDHQQNKRSDYTGRREAGGSSNGQQLANQRHCHNEQDFGRNRNVPPRLQEAVSRDEGDNCISADIHPRIQNTDFSRYRNLPPHLQNRNLPPHLQNRNLPPRLQNRNLPPRLQNRNLPPCLQKAPPINEEDNFVSPDIHSRTWNIAQQLTDQRYCRNERDDGRNRKRSKFCHDSNYWIPVKNSHSDNNRSKNSQELNNQISLSSSFAVLENLCK
jgi:hypothetical protein